MKKTGIVLAIIILIIGLNTFMLNAQTHTSSTNLVAQPIPDRTVTYDVSGDGVSKPINWGLDLAWLDEANIIRGTRFIGKNNIDVIRSSFMPTDYLVGDTALYDTALMHTNERIRIITDNLGTAPGIVLNCDHPKVHSYFYGNAVNWANLIDITRKMHEDAGLTVVTVSPFNEPDYSLTGQGTIDHFYAICGELKNDSNFDNIRISGGNTLNTDSAKYWYNYLKDRLDEGNTHQLEGTFDNYASFFETVRSNGHHATNDELHNIMEAMVGVEYGLQTGIWWGTAEYARGEFCKASYGERLGYAEHRTNWTSAAVYRNPNGDVQAFGGTSERQAAATSYRFFSKDKPVFYDGHGPQYEYIMDLPGGVVGSYQKGQTNAEKVVNITWGDDIQPVIDGKYILVNRNSGKVMEASFGNTSDGTNIRQGPLTGATYQQWNVKPIDPANGGDFSYFNITGVPSSKHLDIQGFSLENGGNALLYSRVEYWDERQAPNQVWYLEYHEDGWFFIRNQFSSYCLEVAGGSTVNGANIQQYELKGGTNQQWRFIPVGVEEIEFVPPSAPTGLEATALSEAIQLNWVESPETDVAGYTIYRSETADSSYNVIARNVPTTTFIDNSATDTTTYFYVVSAQDSCLNVSEFSAQASAAATNEKCLLAKYSFENSLQDSSIYLNHGAAHGSIYYTDGILNSEALRLNGYNAFLQLPPKLVSQDSITIAMWVYWNGGGLNQKIFDFGNGETERMYLTTSTSLVDGELQFVIKHNSVEQVLSTNQLNFKEWIHVAITLNANEARMYVDGELVDESDVFTLSPADIDPKLNYIGRSQSSYEPLFNGSLDDLIMYNYALSKDDIGQIVISGQIADTNKTSVAAKNRVEPSLSVWPVPAKEILNVNYSFLPQDKTKLTVFDAKGRILINKEVHTVKTTLDTSTLQKGIYLLRLTNGKSTLTKKFIIE